MMSKVCVVDGGVRPSCLLCAPGPCVCRPLPATTHNTAMFPRCSEQMSSLHSAAPLQVAPVRPCLQYCACYCVTTAATASGCRCSTVQDSPAQPPGHHADRPLHTKLHCSPSADIRRKPSRIDMRLPSCTCSSILRRSTGAVAVLLIAPARPSTKGQHGEGGGQGRQGSRHDRGRVYDDKGCKLPPDNT